MATTTLDDVDPVMVARLERASADLRARVGWTWDGYTRTSCTHEEQDVFWQKYQQPPHWPTAANPNARGYSIDLRGAAFTQYGSLHMLQPDRAMKAQAVDIAWPGATHDDEVVHALTAAPILAEHGLGFPIAGEYWHCQWHFWGGEYLDHHEATEDDVRTVILGVNGGAAQFVAPMAKTPDGREYALYAVWLPTGDATQVWLDRGCVVETHDLTDFKGVPLFGPVPHGDTIQWTAEHFLAVS